MDRVWKEWHFVAYLLKWCAIFSLFLFNITELQEMT